MEKKPIVIKANRVPNPLKDFGAEQDRKIEQLKEQFGQEKIVNLLNAGFSKDTLIAYLEKNESSYSSVIKAVQSFLQAKALLEFHDIQSAEHIAAILVAPMNGPEFPRSIGIDDGVYVNGQIDANVTGKINT